MPSKYTPAYIEQGRQERESLAQGIGKAAEMAQQQKLVESGRDAELRKLILGEKLKEEQQQANRKQFINDTASAMGVDKSQFMEPDPTTGEKVLNQAKFEQTALNRAGKDRGITFPGVSGEGKIGAPQEEAYKQFLMQQAVEKAQERQKELSAKHVEKASGRAQTAQIPQTAQAIQDFNAANAPGPGGKTPLQSMGMAAKILPEWVSRHIPQSMGGLTDEQANALQQFQSLKAQGRHALYGARLTAGEIAQFDKITQTPDFYKDPSALQRFTELMRKGAESKSRNIESSLTDAEKEQYREGTGLNSLGIGVGVSQTTPGGGGPAPTSPHRSATGTSQQDAPVFSGAHPDPEKEARRQQLIQKAQGF